MSAYKVVLSSMKKELSICDALERGHWFGYKTKNGNKPAILHKFGEPSFGFFSKGNMACFTGSSRECAIRQAIHAGREVLSAPTLTELATQLEK